MKRIIQFRGYNLKNKKWLHGYYLVNRGKHYIVKDEVVEPFAEESDFEVDPESVGQYVIDYKGKPIYEGDIVEVIDTAGYKLRDTGAVVYDCEDCRFNIVSGCYMIPITGKELCLSVGLGGSCKFFYGYSVIGNEYEKKLGCDEQ